MTHVESMTEDKAATIDTEPATIQYKYLIEGFKPKFSFFHSPGTKREENRKDKVTRLQHITSASAGAYPSRLRG